MPLYLPTPPTPSAEQGLTLIELLVAMLTAIVVLGALLAILEFTLGQEARITDRVQADQIGRTAMSNIIDELHSSCTGVTPIQAPTGTPVSPLAASGPLNLWFISAYGVPSSGEASLTSVTEHDINWTATKTSNTGKKLGTLRNYAFTSEPTSKYPEWKFPSPTESNATVKILAKNVVPLEVSGASTIFQYYRYESSASGAKLVALPSSQFPLSEATAKEVAKVTIGFTQAPEGEDTRLDRTVNFSDSVIFRIDPTETGSEGACE